MLQAYSEGAGTGETVKPLADLIDDYNINDQSTVVEVGSFAGVTTELFALRCKQVYAIDPWDLQFEQDDPDQRGKGGSQNHETVEEKLKNGMTWKENVMSAERIFDGRMAAYDNVTKIKGFSGEEASKFEDGSIDLVYLDGRHNFIGVRSDILNFYPKIKVGGVLAGHDYLCRAVRRCVIYLMDNYFERKRYSDGSWAFLKDKDVELEIPANLKL